MKYDFSNVIREISGFGGNYEKACRAMVVAGLEWVDAHPEATYDFSDRFHRVDEWSADATTLVDAMVAAVEAAWPGSGSPSGAMVSATVNHVMFVRAEGWDAYVAKMSEREMRA